MSVVVSVSVGVDQGVQYLLGQILDRRILDSRGADRPVLGARRIAPARMEGADNLDPIVLPGELQ
jgi:hypothetical protein